MQTDYSVMVTYDKALAMTIAVALLASVCSAQTSDDKLKVGGQIEWFGISAQRGGQFKTQDRIERYQIHAEKGPFQAVVTWLAVPNFSLQELNETYVKYDFGRSSLRVGRVMPLIGQSNWEDQWYLGFVMLPFIETAQFDTNWNLYRTINGADLTTPIGNHTLQLSALSSNDDNEMNKVVAKSLNRGAFRIEGFSNGTTYGFGALGDFAKFGKDMIMYVADIRHAIPHWTFRGEILSYSKDQTNVNGYFIDVYHRPANWTDITFVGRYQQIRTSVPKTINREGFTLGGKLRLPFDFGLDVNYAFGPDVASRFAGGGWEFQLRRTFTF